MESIDQTSDFLAELVAWTRVLGAERLGALLQRELQKKSDHNIYSATDGTRSQAEVAKLANVNQSTVSRKWKRWKDLGLVYDSSSDENPRYLMPPQMFELRLPDE